LSGGEIARRFDGAPTAQVRRWKGGTPAVGLPRRGWSTARAPSQRREHGRRPPQQQIRSRSSRSTRTRSALTSSNRTRVRDAGWEMTPRGGEYDEGQRQAGGRSGISPKYVGDKALVQVAIADGLPTARLMLTGGPARQEAGSQSTSPPPFSGHQRYVVQGTPATARRTSSTDGTRPPPRSGPRTGPGSSPVLRAMREGQGHASRRSPAQVGDPGLPHSSYPRGRDSVSEWRGGYHARAASTSSHRQQPRRGVNEMLVRALKRRFNFVTSRRR